MRYLLLCLAVCVAASNLSAGPRAMVAGSISASALKLTPRDTPNAEDRVVVWDKTTGKPVVGHDGQWKTLVDPVPGVHQATHRIGGSDALPAASSSVAGLARLGTTTGTACAGNDSRLSDSRAPTAHQATHRIGGSDPLPAASTSVAGLSAYGTTTGTACQGNDSRLTNARTPTAHAITHVNGVDDIPITDGLQRDGSFLRPLYGNSSGTICQGNDARLSDSRAPTAHQSAHRIGGSDPLPAGTTGIAGLLQLGTGAGQACEGNDSRLSNSRTPTAHAASHKLGAADSVGASSTVTAGLMTPAQYDLVDLLTDYRSGTVSLTGSATSTVVTYVTPATVALIPVASPMSSLTTVQVSASTVTGFTVTVGANAGTLDVSWIAGRPHNP